MLNLTAFQKKDTSKVSPYPKLTDYISAPISLDTSAFQTKTTTPTITEEKGMARVPFGLEPREIPGGKAIAGLTDIASRIIEVVPKAIAFTLANYKGTMETIVGKPPQPLDLGFDARRLGFEEQKIKDVGTVMVDNFLKRTQESSNTPVKNIAMSVLEGPISQVFDVWAGEAVLKSVAISALKATGYDPVLKQAINRLGLKIPVEKITPEVVKEAFKREFQILAGNEGTTIPLGQQFNELGQATLTVMDRLYGKGIPQLNRLGKIVQETAESIFKNITPEELSKIPIGLSIKDVSGGLEEQFNLLKNKVNATEFGKKVLENPNISQTLKEFIVWFMKRGEPYSKARFSTYTDGEPYFSQQGAEMSFRDFINRRDELISKPEVAPVIPPKGGEVRQKDIFGGTQKIEVAPEQKGLNLIPPKGVMEEKMRPTVSHEEFIAGKEIETYRRIKAEKVEDPAKKQVILDRFARQIIKESLVKPPMTSVRIIKNLQNIAKPSPATTFYRKEEIQSWIRAIKKLQSGKELSNMTVSRIKKALQIENIKTTDQPKLQKLYEFMQGLEKGDAFLSPKQIQGLQEILKGIEKPDLMPKRVVIDMFGEKDEVMGKGITGRILNELMPSVDIKEGHPLVSKIVDKSDNLLFEVEKEIERRDKNLSEMLKKAEKSRELPLREKVKRFITPQNKEIFQAMSGQKVNLTKEETAVVSYLKNFFKKVKEDLKLEKYRRHYITHLEKPLLEKIASEGLIKAVADIFTLKEKEGIPLNIMLELDNIIGSEKFFRFALERKGGISPTTNIRKIVHSYSSLYETKKALDQILPEGQAVVKLLLQPKTAVWTKKFLQNLKNRGLDYNFRSGKMGWLAKLADNIVDIGYIKLLGLNYWSALKNLVAGEANSFIYQGLKEYLLGKQRYITSPIKSTKMALEYGVLEGTFADYAQMGIGKLKGLQDLAMIGQKGGEYEIRTSLFVSELTPEEFASGEISVERVRKIKNDIAITQGIFSKTDSPLWLQTWYGRLFMQMNRWRITNLMLLRRLVKDKNIKGLSKAFILYGIGMFLSYELGKAGYKKAKAVAISMAQEIHTVIEMVTLEPIVDALTDNPTLSVLKEFAFTIQELANYIGVPGVEEPSGLEFQQGIEETWIAPVERTKELLGTEPQKAKDILTKYGIGATSNVGAKSILQKYGIK